MTNEQFCFWLQGFIEIGNPEALTKEQVQIIKDHLQLVFTKVTPSYGLGINSTGSSYFPKDLTVGNVKYFDYPPASC
jgi:hypothetical protein